MQKYSLSAVPALPQNTLRVKITPASVNNLPAGRSHHGLPVEEIPFAIDLFPAPDKSPGFRSRIIVPASDPQKAILADTLAVKIIGIAGDPLPAGQTRIILDREIISLPCDPLESCEQLPGLDRSIVPVGANLEEAGNPYAAGIEIVNSAVDPEEFIFDSFSVRSDVVGFSSDCFPAVFLRRA